MQAYQSALKILKQGKSRGALFILGVLLFLQYGCGERNGQADVSGIRVDLEVRRLDKDLASLDTSHAGEGLKQLKKIYPDFLDFYLDTLMGFNIRGNYDDTSAGVRLGLLPFVTHPDIRGLFDTVRSHFPDTKRIDEELAEGFRYMKHYYPSYTVPGIIYLITGLNQWSVFTVDSSIIGIGLDMYLGEQYPFYLAVQMPDYVIRKCRPEYIPVNTFQAIYRERHPFIMNERTLLDMMIQRGKEQYFLSRLLPDADDTLRLGYSRQQLEWCKANEAGVYDFFITKNLLYETNQLKVLRYVNDGPSATGMPAESPGNIGTWLGYRIVRAYIERHPDISMEELFAMEDAQKLLQESKYKPR